MAGDSHVLLLATGELGRLKSARSARPTAERFMALPPPGLSWSAEDLGLADHHVLLWQEVREEVEIHWNTIPTSRRSFVDVGLALPRISWSDQDVGRAGAFEQVAAQHRYSA